MFYCSGGAGRLDNSKINSLFTLCVFAYKLCKVHLINTCTGSYMYTVFQKTSRNLVVPDLKNSFTAEKHMKFATEAFNISCQILSMLLHYLWISKVSICCKVL